MASPPTPTAVAMATVVDNCPLIPKGRKLPRKSLRRRERDGFVPFVASHFYHWADIPGKDIPWTTGYPKQRYHSLIPSLS